MALEMNYGKFIRPYEANTVNTVTYADNKRITQVYDLTHDGAGNSRPFLSKAFISFTFGDKKIEDFGLIATTVDNRLNRENLPEHQDYTTEYKMLHGQFYWGSNYKARELTLTLATDSMTQYQLDAFKQWFEPGEIRELVLAQHPNRAIMARVSNIDVGVLPFQLWESKIVDGSQKQILVINYKGSIQITFVMDDPFWYAKRNVLGVLDEIQGDHTLTLVDKWIDANGQITNILDDDAYKVMMQDRIPIASMIQGNENINFADKLQLKKYNPYKYTLSNNQKDRIPGWQFKFNEYTGEDAAQKDYAPLVNEEMDITYMLSGAIVGPVYEKMWANQQLINDLSIDKFIRGYTIDNGKIQQNSDPTFNTYVYNRYIPVKSGSNIKYNSNNTEVSLTIYYYQKNGEQYNYLSNSNISFESKQVDFGQDVYIQLKLTANNNITITQLSDFFILNIVTFSEEGQIGNNVLQNNSQGLSYFYSGTAISYPMVNFALPITFNQQGFINSLNNTYTNIEQPYNTINLQSAFSHKLKMTLPSIFMSYNQVIERLQTTTWNPDYITAIEQLRNSIVHPGVRNWIIGCINVYFNNYNRDKSFSQKKEYLDDEVKEVLLEYMKYFFATTSEAHFTPTNDQPEVIPNTFKSLSEQELKFNQLLPPRCMLSQASNINNNINSVQQAKAALNSPFKIEVTCNGAAYYQWQYTTDANFGVWHNISQSDTNNQGWHGTTTAVLQCKKITSSDIGKYLRCIVSNNIDTHSDSEVKIIKLVSYNTNLNITVDNNQVNVTQNSTAELTWKITGSYLNGTPAGESINYRPRFFYKTKESAEWIEMTQLGGTQNYYKEQIKNCQVTFNNSNSDNVIQLKFTVNENDAKDLRGTKFKLLLYTVNAQSLDYDFTQDGEYKHADITINVQRLETDQAKITVTENSNQISDFSSSIGVMPGSTITITISGILNLDTTKSGFYYTSTEDDDVITITPNYSLNNTQAMGSINFGMSNNTTTQYSIYFNAVGIDKTEVQLLTPTKPITIHPYSQEQIAGEINKINFTAPYFITYGQDNTPSPIIKQDIIIPVNNQNQQEKQIDLTVLHSNTVPPNTTTTSMQFILYSISLNFEETQEQDQEETQEQDFFTTLERISTPQATYETSQFQNSHVFTINYTGAFNKTYYCKIVWNFELTINNQSQPYTKTLINNSYQTLKMLSLNVYQEVAIQNQFDTLRGAIYYNINNNNQYIKKADGTKLNTNSFIFSCKITGSYKPSTICWYRQSTTGTTNSSSNASDSFFNPNSTAGYKISINSINNNTASFTISNIRNADVLYSLLNSFTFYCTINSQYAEDSITSSAVKYELIVKTTQWVDIDNSLVNSYIQPSQTKSWKWPIVQVRKLPSYASWGFSSIDNNYSMQYNNLIFSFNGKFPQETWNAQRNEYIDYKSDGTVNVEKYFYPMAMNGKSISSDNLINTYNANSSNSTLSLLHLIKTDEDQITTKLYSNYDRVKIQFSQLSSLPQGFSYKLKLKIKINDQQSTINFNYNDIIIIYNTTNDKSIKKIDADSQEISSILENTTDFNNITAIDIDIGIYYNSTWPYSQIGYNKVVDGSPPGKYEFDSNKIPSITNLDLLQISIQGEVKTNNNNNNNNNNNTLLNSSPKGGMYLRSLTNNYSAPAINQKCYVNLNCETGEYYMQVYYNTIPWPNGLFEDGTFLNDPKAICQVSSLRQGKNTTVNESIGDMILYNNFIFSEQNHFDYVTNTIRPWSTQDRTLCHKVTYDGDIPLQNFDINYKNLYL